MVDTSTEEYAAPGTALVKQDNRLSLPLPPVRRPLVRSRPLATRHRRARLLGVKRRERYFPTPIPTPEPSIAPLSGGYRLIDLSRWRLTLHLFDWILAEILCRILRINPQKQRDAHIDKLIRRFSGVWLLLGQVVSSQKSHLHSKDLIREFAPLRPLDLSDIQAVMLREFGRPLESIFADFNPQPLAAGEFSSIYRARLRHEKVEVVIKVQRPEVNAVFNRDKPILGLIRRMLETFKILPHVQWADQFREIEQIVLNEEDYRYAAASARRARKVFKKSKIMVPKVYEDYSKVSVLTSEYLPVPSLNDFLEFRAREPQLAEEWLAENTISLPNLNRVIFDRMMRQLLEDNMFHIDFCPHNIFLLRDSRIAMVDLDITSVDKQFLNIYTITLRALNNKDYDQAADLLFLMCDALPVVDLVEVKGDIVRCFRAYAARSDLHKTPYFDKGISVLFVALGQVLFHYKIQWGWQLFKIWRSMAALDLTLNALGSEESFLRLLKRYFRKSARRQLRQLYANGLAGPFTQIANTISEMIMFQTASLRRTAREYQGTIGKVEYFCSMMLRFSARAVVVGIAIGAWIYLYQHHRDWFAPLEGSWPVEIIKDITIYPKPVWAITLLVAVYLYFTFRRLAWRLMQKEVKR